MAALEAGGVKVAFNTGFTRNTANVVLEAMGWQDRVSVASDEVAAGRPAPDVVGDLEHRRKVIQGVRLHVTYCPISLCSSDRGKPILLSA